MPTRRALIVATNYTGTAYALNWCEREVGTGTHVRVRVNERQEIVVGVCEPHWQGLRFVPNNDDDSTATESQQADKTEDLAERVKHLEARLDRLEDAR